MTTYLIGEAMTETAPANAGHLSYRGDRRSTVGQIMGPNLLGEYLIAVDATYDPAANRTRVGFDYARQWVGR